MHCAIQLHHGTSVRMGQTHSRLVDGFHLKYIVLPSMLVAGTSGKVILWPKANKYTFSRSFDFLSSLNT